MNVGVAEADITPQTPIDLSGFAARTQPSIGVLDPIFVKAVYLAEKNARLLWLSFDLIALSESFVNEIRNWAKRELQIDHVLLCATHTHAAPQTIGLLGCGEMDAAFLQALKDHTMSAARHAVQNAQTAQLVFTQTNHLLALHRRGPASAHVDSTVSAIGFRHANGDFSAVIVNYPMHPVALGHVNRKISTDWCGTAATQLTESLPGKPIALITNGAAGNLNPPGQPMPAETVFGYGKQIADAIAPSLLAAKPSESNLRIAVDHVELHLETMTVDEIDRHVVQRKDQFNQTPWADRFPAVISAWRDTQKKLLASGKGKSVSIELFTIDLGPTIVIACSGELFSRFTAILRERIAKPLYVIGYANTAFGYIASKEAYTEPGYEVDDAHIFYNSFRAKAGGLELLADRATVLVKTFHD